MTQPPFYTPAGYPPAGPARPTSVTVLAIIGIVWGALELLCTSMSLVFNGAMLGSGGHNPMSPNVPAVSAGVSAFNIAVCVIKLLFSLILLIASIRALSLKPSARKTLLAWSIATIVFATVVSAVTAVWILPQTRQAMLQAQSNNSAGAPPQFQSIVNVTMIVGVVVGWLVSCSLPVCFLIFFRKPNVRAAFAEVAPLPPGIPPELPTPLPPGAP